MPLEYESASSLDSCTASDDGDVVEVPFVGQLYSQRRFQRRRIFLSGCYIDNVFSIQIIIICTKCGQAVCNMQCCCGTKSLRVLKRLASNSPANETVCAEISVTAQVSDGSGIALLALSGAEALCELLQLMLSDLESLYQASAQSLDGKLVWRQQRWQGETNQLNEVQGGIGCAVAAATKSAILRIEGTLQSTEAAVDDVPAWSVVKQPIRLGGQDLVVNRYSTVTITAHKVVRISVAELCWKFLEVLDER
ncbi:hypothetical protein EV179_003704 [Coemansia sp. RSA 487]|nr:hypothetical protein LPJ74_001528 [Coemansia sp. RSA 1843]KAJ2213589.1 hypothetical protein EV179_003704 [Coemansia sp. RSA 487]